VTEICCWIVTLLVIILGLLISVVLSVPLSTIAVCSTFFMAILLIWCYEPGSLGELP
jgi:accessory gene regulator protein AgrB